MNKKQIKPIRLDELTVHLSPKPNKALEREKKKDWIKIEMDWIAAVQNERDRISSRRPSYDEPASSNGLTISVLVNAEAMSRQVQLVLTWKQLTFTQ